jgi:Divergent InlB B-repeat domain
MDWLSRRLRPVGALAAAAALVGAAGASAQPQATKVLRVSKVGDGVVATANGRIRCGTRCSARFARGARITLTATAGRFFSFQRWTGGCVGSAPKCVVFLDRATSIRAVFARKNASVDVAVSGPGNIVAEGQLSCGSSGSDCSGVFPQGAPVTLTPAPTADARFGVWGGACRQAGSGACVLVLEDDAEVTAAFRPGVRSIGPQSLFVTAENARVVSDPTGIDCPTKCEAEFPSGSVVTLRGGGPQRWGVACVGQTSECLLVLDDSTGVSARGFSPPPPPAPRFGVTVTVFGRGAVHGRGIECGGAFGTLLDCENLFSRGTIIVLRAEPQRRARFVGWSGFCSGKKLRCALTVNAAKAVYATFRR